MDRISTNNPQQQPPEDVNTVQITDHDRKVAAWGGAVGTALEQYDFIIYGTAAALVFNHIFFPNVSPAVGYLASFSTFAVGFLARPLGGIFFSKYGEKLGRKWVLVATLYLMGFATFAMGLIPSYDQIGLFAPLLLVICRFMQGFGAGAEMAGATVLLTETALPNKRGKMASLVWVGASVGTALGALAWILVQLLPEPDFYAWGWRLVFFSSIFVTFVAWLIRRGLKESPVFVEKKRHAKQEKAIPLREVFRDGKRTIFRVFLMNVGANGHSYIYQAFIGSFLVSVVKVNASFIPKTLLVGATIAAFTSVLIGRASDIYGRKKIMYFIHTTLFFATIPMFMLLETGNTLYIMLVIIFGFIFAAEGTVSAQAAYFPELFGSKYRYAGVTLGREMSAVFGGGIGPMVCSALLTAFSNSWLPVAIYMMFIMSLSLIGIYISPETRGRSLYTPENAIDEKNALNAIEQGSSSTLKAEKS